MADVSRGGRPTKRSEMRDNNNGQPNLLDEEAATLLIAVADRGNQRSLYEVAWEAFDLRADSPTVARALDAFKHSSVNVPSWNTWWGNGTVEFAWQQYQLACAAGGALLRAGELP
jgi:hypothetical protein